MITVRVADLGLLQNLPWVWNLVKERVPEKQLLVFNVKDGWAPLCQFLGLPIPDAPFPKVNINSGKDGYMDNFWNSSAFMEQCKKEAIQSLIIYLIIISVVGYLTLNTLFWQQKSDQVASNCNGPNNCELWLIKVNRPPIFVRPFTLNMIVQWRNCCNKPRWSIIFILNKFVHY